MRSPATHSPEGARGQRGIPGAATSLTILWVVISLSCFAAPGQLRWRFTTQGSVSSSPAIAANGDVLFGSQDGNVYALNPATGQPRWHHQLGSPVTASPVLAANGTIYVRDGDGNLHALDGVTGQTQRSYALPYHAWWLVSTPVLTPSGDLIVSIFRDSLRRVDPITGSNLWTSASSARWVGSPALSVDDTLVIGSYDGNILGIDATRGTLRWSRNPGGLILGSAAMGLEPTVFLVVGGGFAPQGTLVCLHLKDGSIRWSFPLGNASRSSPIVGPEGTVYVGNDDGAVFAVEGSQGTLRWQSTTEGPIASAPALTRDGTLLVSALDGALYAMDTVSGERLWKLTTGGEIYGSPAIGPDGTIYIGSADRSLYAVEGTAPLALGAWPKFLGNAENRGTPPSATGPPVIAFQSASTSRALGSPLELRVDAVGDLPLTYAWSLNGAPLPTVTGTTLAIPQFAAENAGTYQVTVSNAAGSIISAPMSIVVGYRVEVQTVGRGSVDAVPRPATDGSYPAGSTVRFEAIPSPGHTFAKWTGTTNTESNPIQWIVDGPKTLVAHFPWLPGDTRWQTRFPSVSVRTLTLGEGGTLYASLMSRQAGAPGRLAALDAASGQVRWTYSHPTATSFTGSAIGNDGTLFVGLDHTLEAIDPIQGTRRWVSDLGALAIGTAIGADGTLYVTTRDGALRAIDAASGTIRWTVGEGTASSYVNVTAPFVGLDGTVYTAIYTTINTDSAWIRSYDPSGTRTNWSTPIANGFIPSSMALGVDSSVMALQGSSIIAIDPLTGDVKRSATLSISPPAFGAFTCVGPDNTVYLATYGGTHLALDGSTGDLRWQLNLGASWSAPALAADGTLYVSSTHPFLPGLFAVDSQTGAIRWSFPQRTDTPPIVGSEGVVYVGSNPGAGWYWGLPDSTVAPEAVIYALHGSSPLSTDAPWPSQRHDSGNRASQQRLTGPPQIVAQSRSQFHLLNSTVTVGVIAGGTNLHFEWTLNGLVLPEARGPRLILTNFSQAQTGTYQVRVFNELGSVLSEPVVAGGMFQITRHTRGPGTVTTTPDSDLYPQGTPVQLTAVPTGQRRFLGWFGDVAGTNNPLTVVIHSNIQAIAAFETAVGEKLWERPLAGAVAGTPAIDGDGTIYLATTDGNVDALDPFLGTLRWRFTAGGAFQASPALDSLGRVFIGCGNSRFYALDGATGAQRWRYSAGAAVMSSAALTSDGTVIFGSLDKQVHALDAATGAQRWTYDVGDRVESSPVLTPEGAVILGTGNPNARGGSVVCLDVNTGELRWTNNVVWSVGGSLALGADNSVLCANGNGRELIAFDRISGQRRWATEVGAVWHLNSPVFSPDGLAYLFSGDQGLQALNATTGQLVWSAFPKLFLGSIGNPVVASDGTLYVGIDRQLHALDGASGARKWSYDTLSPIQGGLTLAPEGTVYVTTSSPSVGARLAAIQGGAPLASSGWPKAGGDLGNTGHPPGSFYRPRISVQNIQLPNPPALRIHGPLGQVLQIQAAAELPNWTPLQVVTNSTGVVDWLDLAPPGSRRFYRTQRIQP
ncbi:MAG: PQQ-binding-like beta-propeller repeat protein [Verrucomicrobiales bacterium]|nr:PQQ-binding-like beta-propeller repeat protein [Verrucomicrobiales bacterium]